MVYLVDFEQQVLEPLPDRSSHAELAESEEVSTTLAGRAFLQRRPAVAEREDGTRAGCRSSRARTQRGCWR